MGGISAVIITLNEERNIGRCIDSLQDVADEVIVVDSFSTDDTERICNERNATFIQKEWQGYSQTKNWANEQANHGYILSIDADEALSPILARSILNMKNRLEGVYEFNRLTNYCGSWIKHCGWYPDAKVRLFPKTTTEWQGDFVHEALHFSDDPKVTWLAGDLYHYSYYTVGEHIDRMEKYAMLHAQQLKKDGKQGGGAKLLIAPLWKFFQTFFLRLGFLDGGAGYTIARLSARAVKLKYAKLNELG